MATSEIFRIAEQEDYGKNLVNYPFTGKDIFVVSDLHMAAGMNGDGNYLGTENFFADNSFKRFIDHLIVQDTEDPSLLVINGDLVDFLRITAIPDAADDFIEWQYALSQIGISKTINELKAAIDKKEYKFGLKTDDYKSVWKLYKCVSGHWPVFEALGKWLLKGNKLIIVKGNHDLEWYWKPVRDYLQLVVAEKILTDSAVPIEKALSDIVIPNITFVDNAVLVNEDIYIEHGHRYENFTTVDGPPVLKNTKELNLPFGSFFNRYLINRVELAYPYIDDVRPRENLLPVLIRERFPLAVKLLFYYIPLAILVIPKRQYKYAFRFLFQFLVIIIVPLAVTVFAVVKFVLPLHVSYPSGVLKLVLPTLESMGYLVLSYFLGRLLSLLQLTSPAGLSQNAANVFEQHQGLQLVTFGHTHDPEQMSVTQPGRRYYNTGTWIPVFETDAADIRLDKTYTFLHIVQSGAHQVKPAVLMRWNDDAMRVDELLLMARK